MDDAVTLKRLVRGDDPDFASFSQLYARLIDDRYRFDPAGIAAWVDESCGNLSGCGWESYLYLLKSGDRVIGFIYFEYLKAGRILFVGWMGMDNTALQVRRLTAAPFFTLLDRLFTTKLPGCKALVTEIAAPSAAASGSENRRRAALGRLIRFFANRTGRQIFRLDMPYLQPVPDRKDPGSYAEEEMDLLYMPLDPGGHPPWLSKEDAARILDLLYLDIYTTESHTTPAARQAETRYLQSLFDRQVALLPGQVPLIPL